MVGPTATELESLNELIRFDHVYYKATSPEATTTILSPVKPKPQTSGGAKVSVVRKSSQKPIRPKPVPEIQVQPQIQLPNISLDDGMTQESLDRLFDLNAILEGDLQENDNTLSMPALASRDVVALPPQDTINSFGGCAAVSKDSLQVPANNVSSSKLQSRKRRRQSSNCDVRGNSSPKSLRLSSDDLIEDLNPLYDSFYGSDVSDALSPRSDVASPLGSDTWEESFTELFPSLQTFV